jgi:CTP synthase (UTP-ammonia lyase)
MPRLALIGDYDPHKTAHRAIPQALELAGQRAGIAAEWTWIGTARVGRPTGTLAAYDGIWVVPGSPYEDMAGALAAIRFAREQNRPLLGTCGGFQHALIGFARDVAGLTRADHAETASRPCNLIGYKAPGPVPDLVITPLACSLVEKTGDITFTPGSHLHHIFKGQPAHEGYRCNYGVNPDYRARLEAAGLRFTGFDGANDIRAFELPGHRFFIGTLFQPERSALQGQSHPLIEAFVRAAAGG